MELLVELCGGENLRCELWEDLGIALRLSELMLENICKEEGSDLEKRKQCVLNVCSHSKHVGVHYLECLT